ncbi:glycosyltransferase family 32 protein [Butyrivibrio sp. WCD2001]|uniref:glycosyltransferase family 32 protein n=1 Tax=Butyrivibrio sp. WCD2001 TaxID=1280681 RepID=UPI0004170A8F|nr:glycosyltransferase [Butyrivibrio sp. WCD2001]
MAKIINCDMEYVINNVFSHDEKTLIVFGTGRKFQQIVDIYGIEKKILYAIDNAIDKQDTVVSVKGENVPVYGLTKLLSDKNNSHYKLLITSAYAISAILQQINSYEELSNIEVYPLALIQDNCKNEKVTYTKGKILIPKVIHYCWFGGSPIPDRLKIIMESWKKYCPDYEIVRWDESNYDVRKNDYMWEAYKNKKWGFVPDYARLDIIYNNGGVYLDTDVELLKPLDDLLCDEGFFGFATYSLIAAGLGFGGIKGNKTIKKLRDYYDDKHFEIGDGKLDLRPCTDHQRDVFINEGFVLNNKQQMISGTVLYPMEVFNPKGLLHIVDKSSINTHSIHRVTGSWESADNMKDFYNSINFDYSKLIMENAN